MFLGMSVGRALLTVISISSKLTTNNINISTRRIYEKFENQSPFFVVPYNMAFTASP